MALTDKQFNDIIEALSREWRKSFAETLRDLCTEAGISFKLNLSAQEKKEVLKVLLEKEESHKVIDNSTREKIIEWLETKRGRKEHKEVE